MRWIVREFAELTPAELHDALQLRIEVFVVEQQCLYPEVDGKDPESTHLFGYRADRLIAYARWQRHEDQAILGRIVVRASERESGIGRQLMQQAFAAIGSRTIRISAQTQLESYYQRLGFQTLSKPYDDYGIPHVDMVRPLRA